MIVVFAACLFVMIDRSSLCDRMYPFMSMGKMVNEKKRGLRLEGGLDRYLTGLGAVD